MAVCGVARVVRWSRVTLEIWMYTQDMQSGGVVAIVPTYDGSDAQLEPDEGSARSFPLPRAASLYPVVMNMPRRGNAL